MNNDTTRKVFVYGSGLTGCLYDYGPHYTEDQSKESKEAAVDSLLNIFDDLEDNELALMKNNLSTYGVHYFTNTEIAGAHYCEISRWEMSESEYQEYMGE